MRRTDKLKYIPFSIDDAKNLAKEGEELAGKAFVKTEGFEKAIALLMCITETMWRLEQEHKSFRMELFYNAETLNTNYFFFVPTDKGGSDDTKQGS